MFGHVDSVDLDDADDGDDDGVGHLFRWPYSPLHPFQHKHTETTNETKTLYDADESQYFLCFSIFFTFGSSLSSKLLYFFFNCQSDCITKNNKTKLINEQSFWCGGVRLSSVLCGNANELRTLSMLNLSMFCCDYTNASPFVNYHTPTVSTVLSQLQESTLCVYGIHIHDTHETHETKRRHRKLTLRTSHSNIHNDRLWPMTVKPNTNTFAIENLSTEHISGNHITYSSFASHFCISQIVMFEIVVFALSNRQLAHIQIVVVTHNLKKNSEKNKLKTNSFPYQFHTACHNGQWNDPDNTLQFTHASE